MKKQLLLTGAVLLIGGGAMAQALPQKGGNPKLKSVKQKILQQHNNSEGAKPAAGVNERMTGASSYQGDGLIDSAHFVYSGTRYTAVTNMDLNSYQDYFTPTGALSPIELGDITVNYFGYDTMRYYVKSGSSLLLGAIATKTYNTDDQPVLMNVKNFNAAGMPVVQRRFMISYTGDGIQQAKALLDTSEGFTGVFDTAQVLNVTYASPGQRSQDSSVYPMDGVLEMINYTYNTDGRISSAQYSYSVDGVTYVPDYRATYTYDGSSRLVESLEEVFDGAAWAPDYLDSFAYTGSSPLYTYNKSYSYDGGWVPEYQFDAVLRSDMTAWDTVIVMQDMGMGLMPMLRLNLQYNSNEHLTRQEFYLTDGAGGFSEDPAQEINYYYDEVPLSVSSVATAPVSVQVFPNPASATLSIAAAGITRVAVYNLSGQLMLQQQGNTAQQVMQLNLHSLPAGTYVAEVQTREGSSKVKFVKQ